MKENIETKDVQRTEYLDKNGLDMLWAKVKENIHNQVEVERNRAVAKENSIVDTKADKSALDDYALNTTLAALEQKVTANTTAISAKQDAGKYIPYEKTLDMNTYVLPDDWNIESRVDVGEGKYNSSRISAQSVYVKSASGRYISIGSENIRVDSGGNASNDAYLLLAPTYITVFDKRNSERFLLDQYGIRLEGGDNNHVLTSNKSTINITEYAKKTELPIAATKESLGVVKVGDGLNVADGTISVDTTAIGSGNYIPYNKATDHFYYLYNIGIISQKEDGSNKTIQCPAYFEQSDENHSVTIRSGYINISNTKGNIMRLNDRDGGIVIYKQLNDRIEESLRILEDGIRLIGGDNNHVLTSNASTIDITQYVLKSVYDEKIAALEARIAALEAKHTETA